VAGDLYVHLFTGIHHATGALGPNRIAGMGGQRYWKDGRDVYDVLMGLFDYPETEAHPSFTLSLQTNFEDGGGGDQFFRFVGSDGVITVGYSDVNLTRVGIEQPTANAILKGYNSVTTFSAAQQKELAEQLAKEPPPQSKPKSKKAEKFMAPKGYDDRYDHFVKFFKAVREGQPVEEDAVYGYRAAAPALLCNESYRQGRIIGWDPVKMQVVT
jgi:hypothetical protein